MDYPDGFPEHLKQNVEAAISEAEIQFVKQRKASGKIWGHDEIELLIKRYIRKVMFAFSDSACRAVEEGIWTGENFRKGFARYLHQVTEYVWTKKHPWPYHTSKMMDLRLAALTQIEESKEWIGIQERLKKAAESAPTEPKGRSMNIVRGAAQLFGMIPDKVPVSASPLSLPKIQEEQAQVYEVTPVEKTRQRLEPRPELLKDHEFVGRQTAAKALGISERTLDRRVGDGTLTPVGEGHYVRFKTQDILRVLNRKKSRQSRH